MKYLILIKCIIAANHLAVYPEDAAHANNFPEQPAIYSRCGVCEALLLDSRIDLGNAEATAVAGLGSIACPRCGADFVHLRCASKSLSRIKCHGCGEITCCKTAELDSFIEQLRSGGTDVGDIGICRRVFDNLESLGCSLIIMPLYSYDMTVDELRLLKMAAGICYQRVLEAIDNIIKAKSVFYAQNSKIISSFAGMQNLTAVLVFLGSTITPNFVAEAGEEQIVVLIELLAGHRGAGASISGALAQKIISLADIVRGARLSNSGIKKLLGGLISTDSCAMAKHLVGRHQFGHQLTDDAICAIVEQYAAACAYSDETFVPLLIFLVNGNINEIPNEHVLQRLASRFLQRNGDAVNKAVYAKLLGLSEKCKSGTADMEDAMYHYTQAGDGDFCLSEDLFCAIAGTWETGCKFFWTVSRAQRAGGVHILRHMPISWARINTGVYIGIAEQAMEREDFVMLEEMLVSLNNTRQSVQNICRLFENLLKGSCRNHVGLALRIINSKRLIYLKENGVTDWLLGQLATYNIHWCIPYFRGHVSDKLRYERIAGQYHQEIVSTAMSGEFQFSPLFCEIIRYDAKNAFFTENFQEYLKALLDAFTNRYVVQRLLIETCTTLTFRRMISTDKMAAVYALLKTQEDFFFYLDAFYYALQHTTQKNCLKILILDDLEGSATTGNRWVAASMEGGVLHQRRAYKRCSGRGCIGSGCMYCRIVSGVEFWDLLAALRYARASQ